MTGEIPDPYCLSVQQSKHLAEFARARSDSKNSLLVNTQPDTAVYLITVIVFMIKYTAS